MWELVNIDPTLFNVLSDLTAIVIIWIFAAGLAYMYPYMIWMTIKSGRGVGLNDVVTPPGTLPEAIMRFCKGNSSRLLLFAITLIFIVETFAHTMADFYMDFQSVVIGEEKVWHKEPVR